LHDELHDLLAFFFVAFEEVIQLASVDIVEQTLRIFGRQLGEHHVDVFFEFFFFCWRWITCNRDWPWDVCFSHRFSLCKEVQLPVITVV
jgi:hypothetical protein